MANNEPKMHSITGTLTPLLLTERDNDYSLNVTYLANRSINDICQLAVIRGSKFTASELYGLYRFI